MVLIAGPPIETQEALEIWLRRKLLNDEDITALIDNRVYSVWAEKNAELPYIVHRFDIGTFTSDKTIGDGTLYLDIWDYNRLQRRALRIRGHVVRVLDGAVDHTANNESFVRCNLETDGWITEDTNNIWHRAMQFGVRFTRNIEVENMLA